MKNRTRFSVSVQDFQKILFYSLYFPFQRIPSLPSIKTFAQLIGEPLYIVTPQFRIHRNTFGLPQGCPDIDLNNAEGINMIVSDDGKKTYDSVHVPILIKTLDSQRRAQKQIRSTSSFGNEDIQFKLLIFKSRKQLFQSPFKSPLKSELQSPSNKSPCNFKSPHKTINPQSSVKKLKTQQVQFTNIHDFTFYPQSKYDTFTSSQKRKDFISPLKLNTQLHRKDRNSLDQSFIQYKTQNSISKSLQRK